MTELDARGLAIQVETMTALSAARERRFAECRAERDALRAAQSSPPAGEIAGLVERAMALANAATKGPWGLCRDASGRVSAGQDGLPHGEASLVARMAYVLDEERALTDARFIAASRQLIPELCEAITRLSQPRSCERIVRAAIKWGDAIYSVAPPGRHGDVYRLIEKDWELPLEDDGGPDAQGFLTSTGRFLGRIGAKQCARDAGQLLPTASKSDDLFSEDLW